MVARGGAFLPIPGERRVREKERVQRRTGHVLVVDDDALNRRLVTATLAREGLRTTSAKDGAEALKAIREEPPDVILLDIEMPGIDGFEVLGQIKADEKLRHLPVIMISGMDDTESVVRCLEIGADDFLPKPFDAAILRARINAGLDRKALHDLEHERVRDIFMRFLPEPMVDEVLARTDGDARIKPELLTGTVLFGDLRGFTSFAEGRPVDEVIEAINTYLTLDDRRGPRSRRHARRLHGRRRHGRVRRPGRERGRTRIWRSRPRATWPVNSWRRSTRG